MPFVRMMSRIISYGPAPTAPLLWPVGLALIILSGAICLTILFTFLMTCPTPLHLKSGDLVPCGKCLVCRVNRRNGWNVRLQWERVAHKQARFVGLTYSDEHLPFAYMKSRTKSTPGGMTKTLHATLDPRHFDSFISSLRYSLRPLRLRYYGIGEYGPKTHRPHYHIHIFGDFPFAGSYGDCVYAQEQSGIHCESCTLDCIQRTIRLVWPYGHATSYPSEVGDLCYTTSHHVDAFGSPFPDSCPGFCRMSRRPGIGSGFFSHPLVQNSYDNLNAYSIFTPSGIQTSMPRYFRERLFTKATLKGFSLHIDSTPASLAKSNTFRQNYITRSYKADKVL